MPPVVVYTKPHCSFCVSAKALLQRKGVAFTEINVAGEPERRAEMVERAQGRTTVPQIFVGTTHAAAASFTSLTRPAVSIHFLRVDHGGPL